VILRCADLEKEDPGRKANNVFRTLNTRPFESLAARHAVSLWLGQLRAPFVLVVA